MFQENIVKKFNIYIRNSNLFTIIEGNSGVGKSFFVRNFSSSKKAILFDSTDLSHKKWKTLFSDAVFKEKIDFVIIDHLELSSKKLQKKMMQVFTDLQYKISCSNDINNLKIICVISTSSSYKKALFPTLYKLINQNIFTFPSIKDFTREQMVHSISFLYEKILQENSYPVISDTHFMNWITKQPIEGNFRELINILVHYHTFTKNNGEKGSMGEESVIVFLKNRFEENTLTYKADSSLLKENTTAEYMLKVFKKNVITWAEKVYDGKNELLKKLNISEKTYYNWKNINKTK